MHKSTESKIYFTVDSKSLHQHREHRKVQFETQKNSLALHTVPAMVLALNVAERETAFLTIVDIAVLEPVIGGLLDVPLEDETTRVGAPHAPAFEEYGGRLEMINGGNLWGAQHAYSRCKNEDRHDSFGGTDQKSAVNMH